MGPGIDFPQLAEIAIIHMSTAADAPKPLSANEGLKAASRHLRGSLAQDFADTSTLGISEESAQLTKFHGFYLQDDRDLRNERRRLKQEKAYSFMLRVRLPGGRCTPRQWLALDQLAEQRANGTLRLTTRQTFQLHGVLKGDIRPVIRGMHAVLLDSIAACGDVNRNVMAPPNPEREAVLQQVYEHACGFSEYALPKTKAYHELWIADERVSGGEGVNDEAEPLYGDTYLPRKFKTGFALAPSNDVDIFSQDLGFIAIVENGRLAGYNVAVGGGQGMSHGNAKTYPRLADVIGFIPPDKVNEVGGQVIGVQRDFGDRTDRKHARLKYTIDDRGVAWFVGELERRLGWKLAPARPYAFTTITDPFGWQRCADGTWFYGLHILSGRIKDVEGWKMKTALREIALIHEGDFRLTPSQNLTISGVSEAKKGQIEAILARHGLNNENGRTGLRLNALSCVALPTCGLALAEAERELPLLLADLERVVEEAGLRHDAISLRVTGCPNGCARPYLSEIGLVGKAPGKYNLYLGASFEGTRLNTLVAESLTHEQVLERLGPLLKRYALERAAGERFGDFCHRIGVVVR